jgi:hypothetical protein
LVKNKKRKVVIFMTRKEHIAWVQGYECAITDFLEFSEEHKRLFSSFKSWIKYFYKKFERKE